MKSTIKQQRKARVLGRVILIEYLGFGLAILACWLTELIDPPFSIHQVVAETVILTTLAIFVIFWTRHLLAQIKYLEGFMLVCGNCKKVKIDEDFWVPMEEVLTPRTNLKFSHGICPDCFNAQARDLQRSSNRP